MDIFFDEVPHKYFIPEFPDFNFTSVSKVIELVKPKFNTEERALAFANQDRDKILQKLAVKWKITPAQAAKKWEGIDFTPEVIKQIWKEKNDTANERGTRIHAVKESNGYLNNSLKGYGISGQYKKCLDIGSLQPGVYRELIIPYLPLQLIGTADKIEIFEDKTFIIEDYKTNEELVFKGKSYSKEGVRKMLAPLSHLDDVNGQHYHVQLSLYSFFLEFYGFKYKSGMIRHVQEEIKDGIPTLKEVAKIPHIYYKKEVIALLNFVKFLRETGKLK